MRKFVADILAYSSGKILEPSIFLRKVTLNFAAIIVALFSGVTVLGQDQFSFNEEGLTAQQFQLRSLTLNQTLRRLYQNPGDLRYADTLSLSEAHVGVLHDNAERPVYPQEGTGKTSGSIGAKSFIHLDSKQSVWGDAQFSTGFYKDIKWSNCIDYQKIAPYVLGDEEGGDLSFRQYVFGGGYSYLMDNGLTLGAQLGYRAEIAWRDRDPRVRTIVSDLNFSLGASYRYTQKRFIGVSATVESYTQNCDLDFYNPLNKINTLPLTGMGSYNKRFAGNTNKNSGHSGLGYRLGCHMGSVDHFGVQFDLWFKGFRMNQLLRNFNNITLAYTDTYTTHATTAIPLSVSNSIKMMLWLEGEYLHRLGTENLFGTASGASYDKIGSRSPYLNQHIETNLSVPIEFNLIGSASNSLSSSRTYFTVQPSASYYVLMEELTSLGRKIEIATISPEIELSLSHLLNNWIFDIQGDYGWSSSLSDKWIFPGFDSSNSLQESVASNFMMLSSKKSTYGGEVSITRRVGKMMVGVSVKYCHCNYRVSNSEAYLVSINSTSESSSSSSAIGFGTGVDGNQMSKYQQDHLDISLKINF